MRVDIRLRDPSVELPSRGAVDGPPQVSGVIQQVPLSFHVRRGAHVFPLLVAPTGLEAGAPALAPPQPCWAVTHLPLCPCSSLSAQGELRILAVQAPLPFLIIVESAHSYLLKAC